jgi:hypothetical protein
MSCARIANRQPSRIIGASFKNTIISLILLALAVAGAWSRYDSHLKSQSKDQTMETAERDVRDTAECHLEAFKLRPGLTETDVEIQAAFMDICMEARGYVFLRGTDEPLNAGRTYNLGLPSFELSQQPLCLGLR